MLGPGARVGPFEVLAPLGAGGMGEVYRARDPRLGREVAIKILPADRLVDQTRRRRFVQEARAASALNHPHIVTIHEIGCSDGIDFIVMEYVPGQTLNGMIPNGGMPLRDALRVAAAIADAVAAAHARGIIHRDLKPANVIVSVDGVVKVLDFGLAKLVGASVEDGDGTQTTASVSAAHSRRGVIRGTAAYMSPEQATGGQADTRSDIFSFGAVLYEMVTGRRAFAGQTVSETLTAVVRDQPKSPRDLVPGVPETLDRLIQRCLRKEAERRFQHMADVKVDLQEIAEESRSQVKAPPLGRPRTLVGLIAGGAIALALLAGGWLLWRSVRAEVPPPVALPLTSHPHFEGNPTFSPDGDQVAFDWNGEKGDNRDIYLTMIGSADARRLTTDPAPDHNPSWSPDGRHIAFVRSPQDGKGCSIHLVSPLGGSERKLVEQPPQARSLSWSPDGRWLLSAALLAPGGDGRGVDRGLQMISIGDGEIRALTYPSGAAHHDGGRFSPDGTKLAFVSCVLEACEIDVVDVGPGYAPVGAPRRLTPRAVGHGGLAWTRDGKSIVYGDTIDKRLWRVEVDGGQPPERIEMAGWPVGRPTTARSRDRLAFVRLAEQRDIYRFEVGSAPEVVTASSYDDFNPQFSPDGRRIAFESSRRGETHDIWLSDPDGSSATQLTHGPGRWQGSPRWSPDGRQIAFDSMDEAGRWDIWVTDAAGGAPRRITSDPANDNMPSWSRDGRFIYFGSLRGGAANIWRAPVGGGPPELVTSGLGPAYEALDGKTLYVSPGGPSPLMAVPTTGGPQRQVVDCVPVWGFAVGPAGIYHLSCAGWPHGRSLHVLDPVTERDQLLGKLERALGGISVSPNGKSILYTRVTGQGSDLALIENFR